MRKLVKWTPEEASTVYWLSLWGLSAKDIIELASPILTNRTKEGISAMCAQIRKQLSILKGFKYTVKVDKNVPDLVRKASKIPPVKEIADLRPEDLTNVVFVPTKVSGGLNKPIYKPSPKFEQRPTDYVPQSKTIEEKPFQVDVEKILDGNSSGKGLKYAGNYGGARSMTEKEFEARIKDVPNTLHGTPSLEEVLIIAKKHGAKKVQWRDYIIKFV